MKVKAETSCELLFNLFAFPLTLIWEVERTQSPTSFGWVDACVRLGFPFEFLKECGAVGVKALKECRFLRT